MKTLDVPEEIVSLLRSIYGHESVPIKTASSCHFFFFTREKWTDEEAMKLQKFSGYDPSLFPIRNFASKEITKNVYATIWHCDASLD